MATFVEAPMDLQGELKIPDDHYAACRAGGIPSVGNAAGNTVNLFDLSGQNAPPGPLPAGYVIPSLEMSTGLTRSVPRFTTRGIVALVFSCIVGIIGAAVVAWFGFADVGDAGNDVGLATASVSGIKGADGQPPASSGDDSASAPGGRTVGGDDEIFAAGGDGAQK
jgi:iron transport multicopper oxidase